MGKEDWQQEEIQEKKVWCRDFEGEEGFRAREEAVIDDLTQEQGIVLATGGGSIKSKDNRNRLSARGIVIYLETTIEKQLARTNRDKKRPLLQTDDPQVGRESRGEGKRVEEKQMEGRGSKRGVGVFRYH